MAALEIGEAAGMHRRVSCNQFQYDQYGVEEFDNSARH